MSIIKTAGIALIVAIVVVLTLPHVPFMRTLATPKSPA